MISTTYIRRSSYETASPQEEFMVSLLRHYIEEVLSTYGKLNLPNPCVLDVGCGSQPFRQHLEALGYTYTSADAEQNTEGSVDIICMIDQPLPPAIADPNSFNFIFCTEVMEHVADWNTAFSNFAQLLAPQGRLFITCPHFYKLHEEPYDFWRPTPYALQHFGNKFGLKVLYQAKAGDAWDVLGLLLANISPSPVTSKLKDYLLSKIVSKCRQFLVKLLINRQIQNSVQMNGLFYLSNIVVFEK